MGGNVLIAWSSMDLKWGSVNGESSTVEINEDTLPTWVLKCPEGLWQEKVTIWKGSREKCLPAITKFYLEQERSFREIKYTEQYVDSILVNMDYLRGLDLLCLSWTWVYRIS